MIDQNRVLAFIARCSTIGPSASAGKKVRPPIIRMTPTTRPTNRPPVVGSVPADGGIDFLPASEPASGRAGTIRRKRREKSELASVKLKKKVLRERRAKAEPLLPVAEVKA